MGRIRASGTGGSWEQSRRALNNQISYQKSGIFRIKPTSFVKPKIRILRGGNRLISSFIGPDKATFFDYLDY